MDCFHQCLILSTFAILPIVVETCPFPGGCYDTFIRNEGDEEYSSNPAEAPAGKKPCDEETMMTYLAELQAISPERIINMATSKDVDEVCSHASSKVEVMNQYLGMCTVVDEKDLYYKLIEGVKSLQVKLCKDTDYRQKFVDFSQCFSKLHQEYDQCHGMDDWTENPDAKEVCQSYVDIADCYFVKTNILCGDTGAKVLKELLLQVFNSVINEKCDSVYANPPLGGYNTGSTAPAEALARLAVAIVSFVQVIPWWLWNNL